MQSAKGVIASEPFRGVKGMGLKVTVPDMMDTFYLFLPPDVMPAGSGYKFGAKVEFSYDRMYTSGRDIRFQVKSIKLVDGRA